MTTDYNNEKVIIIKCKAINIFKRTDKKIDDVEKLSCCNNIKFKRILKNIFNLRSRNSDSQFIFTSIRIINSIDNFNTNFMCIISLINIFANKR